MPIYFVPFPFAMTLGVTVEHQSMISLYFSSDLLGEEVPCLEGTGNADPPRYTVSRILEPRASSSNVDWARHEFRSPTPTPTPANRENAEHRTQNAKTLPLHTDPPVSHLPIHTILPKFKFHSYLSCRCWAVLGYAPGSGWN